MGGGFVPFRREVRYWPAQPARIAPLLDHLRYIEKRQRWGYRFRFGQFELPATDMHLIAIAMKLYKVAIDWDSVTPPPCDAPTDSLPLFS